MLYGGCDLGVVSAKASILDGDGLLACEILPYTGFPQEAAAEVLEKALARVGMTGRTGARFTSRTTTVKLLVAVSCGVMES